MGLADNKRERHGMAKLPSFQFYPGDWFKDPDLRRCSLFARGLLVDLLCLMFEAKHRGRLTEADGVTPWSDADIALAVGGATKEEIAAGLQELQNKNVLSRDDNGCLYSRRMVREERLRLERAAAGSKGGSKTQAKRKARGQANDQANSRSSSSSSSSEEIDAHARWPSIDLHRVVFPRAEFDTPEIRDLLDRWVSVRNQKHGALIDPEQTITAALPLFPSPRHLMHNLRRAVSGEWKNLANREEPPSGEPGVTYAQFPSSPRK